MSHKWDTTGRTHDLFPGHATNGKGDADRTTNDEQYRKNYDEIDWKREKKCGCELCAEEATGYCESGFGSPRSSEQTTV